MSKLIPKNQRPAAFIPNVHSTQWEHWRRTAASPEYAKAAFKVLNAAGRVTRQAYLEMLLDMESRYPGRGWREEMNDLEAFYCKYGLDIKDYPRVRDLPNVVAQ